MDYEELDFSNMMVGSTEEDFVPIHEVINMNRKKDDCFTELVDYYLQDVCRSEREATVLMTAFDIYSVAYIDINLRATMNDDRVLNKYRNARNKIAQLFEEIEGLVPEDCPSIPETQEKEEVLNFIDQRINFLGTTKNVWKKIHRNNTENYMIRNGIKEYRHKDIFVVFHKILSEYQE